MEIWIDSFKKKKSQSEKHFCVLCIVSHTLLQSYKDSRKFYKDFFSYVIPNCMIISWFLGLVKRIGKTENQLKKIIGGKTC